MIAGLADTKVRQASAMLTPCHATACAAISRRCDDRVNFFQEPLSAVRPASSSRADGSHPPGPSSGRSSRAPGIARAQEHDHIAEKELAKALDDRGSFRRFCGFLAQEPTPERTAFVRFHKAIMADGLDKTLFDEITPPQPTTLAPMSFRPFPSWICRFGTNM